MHFCLRRLVAQQLCRQVSRQSVLMQRAGYAVVSSKPQSAKPGYELSRLARPLEEELRYNRESMEEDESLSVQSIMEKYGQVVAPWKLNAEPNVSVVTLVQEQPNGVKTIVRFDSNYVAQAVNDAAAGENLEHEMDQQEEEEMDEDVEDYDGQDAQMMVEPFPVFVEVTAGRGLTMEAELEVHPDLEEDGHSLAVSSISLKRAGMDQSVAYPGPVFNSLDDKLQEAFGKWAERNFLPLVPFITEYSRAKEAQDYNNWLEGVKTVVEAK